MTFESHTIRLQTRKEGEILDITGKLQKLVSRGGVTNGLALVFVPGSTAALTTMEYEPGVATDLLEMLERLAPRTGVYAHEKRWHDGNGHSHIRAALIGPDLNVPVRDKKLALGTWQQIVLIELDVRPRDRAVHLQLMGE